MKENRRYKKVGVGGTFDILHKGHEELLKKAFRIGETVVIGLTTDKTTNKKARHYKEREKNLKTFLKENNHIKRCKIIELKNPYGTAADDKKMDALVVSEETKKQADKINQLRKRKKLPPLKIITIPLELAEDKKPISTTRIKKGKIDRNGKLI